jgi:release factor glutamine methyltransferase
MFSPTNRISDIIANMQRELSSLYEPEEIRSFWFILMEEYCGLSKTKILTDKDRTISESEMLKVHFAIKELRKFRPIQYIIGKAWFCGLELTVTPDVLIPRPETEELVAWILSDYSDNENERLKILDIGTGSGCIAIALGKSLPFAEVTAIDDSDDAISVALDNSYKNKCKITFELIDILEKNEWNFNGQFDLIVSNPPYIRLSEMKDMKPNVLQYEPESALFVLDNDPLIFNRAILRYASLYLAPGGAVYFEINEALGKQTYELALDSGFTHTELRKDLSGKDRMIKCRR